MKLSDIDRSRSGLVQLLIVLIMAFLGLILALARSVDGYAVEALVILALGSCLYVMARERSLRGTHGELLAKVLTSQRQVHWLGEKLASERNEASAVQGHLRELTRLYRAISTVNAVMDRRATFGTVLDAALELVGGDCGSVMLLDETRTTLMFAAVDGLGDEVQIGDRLPASAGVAGAVIRRGEPFHACGDLRASDSGSGIGDAVIGDEVGGGAAIGLEPRATSMKVGLSCPLALRGQTIGVINVGLSAHADRDELSECDVRSVTIFAQHATIAIENARSLAPRSSSSRRPLAQSLRPAAGQRSSRGQGRRALDALASSA